MSQPASIEPTMPTMMFRKMPCWASVRIDVPMDSRVNLAKFGEVLKDLGENLQTLSKSKHMMPRQAMIEASFQCYAARKLILGIAGQDKPSHPLQMRRRILTKLQA